MLDRLGVCAVVSASVGEGGKMLGVWSEVYLSPCCLCSKVYHVSDSFVKGGRRMRQHIVYTREEGWVRRECLYLHKKVLDR